VLVFYGKHPPDFMREPTLDLRWLHMKVHHRISENISSSNELVYYVTFTFFPQYYYGGKSKDNEAERTCVTNRKVRSKVHTQVYFFIFISYLFLRTVHISTPFLLKTSSCTFCKIHSHSHFKTSKC
jgi:hypothetical protein